MTQLRKVLTETNRRSLWQVLGVYALASWVIWQVVGSLYEWIGLPDWVPGTALVLLLIGLPIVLATAFVQQGAPSLPRDSGADRRAAIEGLETTTEVVAAKRRGEEAAVAAEPEESRHLSGAGPNTTTSTNTKSRAAALFTWSRAVTFGVLAFAALGLAASGFMGMRALGIGPAATLVSSGALDEADPVVLADLANATSDSTLGVTLTGALRVDLDRSDVLRLVSGEQVREALHRMQREPDAPLTAEVAREIARRDGYKAWIEGEVRELGGQYVLSASVVASADGRVLASFRETAAGPADLITAVDRLSDQIRSKVGESLRSIRAEEPLPEVTTGSLAALASWTEGMLVFDRKGDQLAALRHAEAALEADSTFASAWMMVGIVLDNLGIETDRQLHAVAKAFEYRARLPRRERHWIEGLYYSDVGERDRAIDAYEAALALDSTGAFAGGALNNLALLYRRNRQHDRAAETFRRAIRTSAEAGWGTSLQYANYINQLTYAGRFDDARAAFDSLAAKYPDHRRTHSQRIAWAGHARDYAAVDSLAREHLTRFGDALEGRNTSLSNLAYSAGTRGRLREAERHFREMEREAAAAGWHGRALTMAGWTALMRGVATQDFGRAVADLDAAVERHGIDDLPPDDVPYTWLAFAYARLGASDRARDLLDRWERATPPARQETEGTRAAEAEALIAVAEGRPEDAEAALETAARRNFCDFCRLPTLGMLREQQGREADAVAVYREYLETPWLHRLDDDVQHRAFVIQRLADLHERLGDSAGAARYQAQLIELWAGADPELQPRVDAARRALARLTGEGR